MYYSTLLKSTVQGYDSISKKNYDGGAENHKNITNIYNNLVNNKTF